MSTSNQQSAISNLRPAESRLLTAESARFARWEPYLAALVVFICCAVLALGCGKDLPTARDARDAMTRACVLTASAEALVKGKQLPSEIEKFCSNPELQNKLTNVVQKALDLNAAVIDLHPAAGADAGP
jgi:hypothetical protein